MGVAVAAGAQVAEDAADTAAAAPCSVASAVLRDAAAVFAFFPFGLPVNSDDSDTGEAEETAVAGVGSAGEAAAADAE